MCVPRPVSRRIAGASYAATLQSSATFSGVHLRLPLAASSDARPGRRRRRALTSATVPPRNCGPLTVGQPPLHHQGRPAPVHDREDHAKNYLVSHRKPRGFTCRNFKGSKMTFRCSKGIQVFFAIRR